MSTNYVIGVALFLKKRREQKLEDEDLDISSTPQVQRQKKDKKKKSDREFFASSADEVELGASGY